MIQISWKRSLVLGVACFAVVALSVIVGPPWAWLGIGLVGAGVAFLEGAWQLRSRASDADGLAAHRERMERLAPHDQL